MTNENIPIYTSFTNPGFSFHFQDSGHLGSTSLKSHPIPVNKIPFTEPYLEFSTEPSKKVVVSEMTTNSIKADIGQHSDFIEVETIKHKLEDVEESIDRDYPVKDISSIFYNLATTFNKSNLSNIAQDIYQPLAELIPEAKEPSGQGQVEVVEVDVEELLTHTTEIPLVTLLPVRSNSGIGRPFNRNRFGDTNNLSVENRSFPSQLIKQNLDIVEKPKNKTRALPNPTNISTMDNYKIVGVLNFAKEGYDDSEVGSHHDIIRFPKMDLEADKKSRNSVNYSSSVTTSGAPIFKSSNLLSLEKIKQLSEISKIHDNDTFYEDHPVISTKAISSSYSINHNGFKILKKTFNKLQDSLMKNDTNSLSKQGYNINYKEGGKKTKLKLKSAKH